jgi:quinoprotein glucose dehydrogenase
MIQKSISLAAFLTFCLSTAGCRSEVARSSREWPVYGGDAGGTKYSELSQIHRGNVHRLEPAWIYRTGDKRERPASTIQCNPLVIGGVMYITTPALKVVALRAASGEKLWEFDPGTGARGVNRGLAFWGDAGDRRLFHTAGP